MDQSPGWSERVRAWPVAYYAGFALGRIASIVVIPIVAQVAGPAGFGRFEVALAVIVATAILFDAGVGSAIVRYWSDSRVERRTVVGSAVITQLAASAVAVAVFGPVMIAFAPHGESRVSLVLAMVLFALVEGLAVVASGLLRAQGRDRDFFLLSVSRFVATISFGAYGAATGGASGALFGVALGGLGFALFTLHAWWRQSGAGSRATRRTLRRYGFPLIATTLATWMLSLSDRLFLRFTVPSREIGQYAANYRLGGVVLLFLAAPLGLVWIPEAQRTLGHLRGAKARSWALGYSATALLLGGVVVLIGPAFVPFFFGHEFVADRLVIGLVALSGWLAGLYYLIGTPVLLGDTTRALAVGGLATVVVNLVLNAALIPAFEARGAAVATILSYAALCLTALVAARRAPARTVAA